MSTDTSAQGQRELLQHIAAIHERKPGHHRDLSLEAMTTDLDRIVSRSTTADSIGFTPRPVQALSLAEANTRSNARGDAADGGSSVAGVDGSRQSS
jgi:hypothetical protein